MGLVFVINQEGRRSVVRLTMRAADGGYAPHFLSMFLALGVSRFEGESTLPPTAANADRWAFVFQNYVVFLQVKIRVSCCSK
jgi:hypothetical protein